MTEDERLNRIENTLSDVLNSVSRTVIKQPRSNVHSNTKFVTKHAKKLLNESGRESAKKFLVGVNDYSLLQSIEVELSNQKRTNENKILIELANYASFEADIPF